MGSGSEAIPLQTVRHCEGVARGRSPTIKEVANLYNYTALGTSGDCFASLAMTGVEWSMVLG